MINFIDLVSSEEHTELKTVVTDEFDEIQYDQLIMSLPKGSVFYFNEWLVRYETILKNLEEFVPENQSFRVRYIEPGTSLFSMYGSNAILVIENEIDGVEV